MVWGTPGVLKSRIQKAPFQNVDIEGLNAYVSRFLETTVTNVFCPQKTAEISIGMFYAVPSLNC